MKIKITIIKDVVIKLGDVKHTLQTWKYFVAQILGLPDNIVNVEEIKDDG